MREKLRSAISVVSATAVALARKPRGPSVKYGYSATAKALYITRINFNRRTKRVINSAMGYGQAREQLKPIA